MGLKGPKGDPATGCGGSGKWIGNIWGVWSGRWDVRKVFFFAWRPRLDIVYHDLVCRTALYFVFVHHCQRHGDSCSSLFVIPGVLAKDK
jgi:hypothetical protein